MASAEELVRDMDAQGIEVSVALGYGWCDPGLARETNDYLLDAARRFPGRVIPFCSVNPCWGRQAAAEMERCAALGARGVGELHPDTQGFDPGNAATMGPMMEAAQAHGLMVLVHSSEPVGHDYPGKGRTTPEVLLRFIINFPQATIVCAHWGGGLPFYALMPEVRRAMTNVYVDTASSLLLYQSQVWPAVARMLGPDKILFGSDYPLATPGRMLRQVEETLPDAGERQRILHDNAAALLRLRR